jgi:hypothetical protein
VWLLPVLPSLIISVGTVQSLCRDSKVVWVGWDALLIGKEELTIMQVAMTAGFSVEYLWWLMMAAKKFGSRVIKPEVYYTIFYVKVSILWLCPALHCVQMKMLRC